METDQQLLLLFDRPKEPVYVPKGEEKIVFDVPPKYLPEKYQPMAERILERFGEESLSSIPIKEIAIPNISDILQLDRQATFSLFIPSHRVMAGRLIELMMGMRTVEDFMSLSAYCRDRVNPQMFVYCFSTAILHREDTKHLPVPNLSEVFPDKYLDSQVLSRIAEETNIVPAGSRKPIEIPMNYTATDVDPEHRVAYFREDIGINCHHTHWHLVYPFTGPKRIINKDRRGELFYYMHHQIMARYNVERLCNKLHRTLRLKTFREAIPEAYFPKMDSTVAGRAYPARPAHVLPSDINRTSDGIKFTITDVERSGNRILQAIRTKEVHSKKGPKVILDEKTGIDTLGNIMEASDLSPNFEYYGDFHNYGHMLLGYAHDPDHRFLENFAVMADSSTAMRDPAFYRWHAFIDSIFGIYKNTLPAYTDSQLIFEGVTVTDIHIATPGGNPNTLNTHWTKSDVELSRGLDFQPRGSVFVRMQHLNHDNFSYNFIVNNSNSQEVMGTVRVFIAPRFDETGHALRFDDQRMHMIEMDKFTTRLKTGENTINRNSTESAITIPFEATFRNLTKGRPKSKSSKAATAFNFCGCGWPQHMLVPKGTTEGYPMDLFVMVSNYQDDKVEQEEPIGCRDGVSFCGLRDRKFPDARSMGYPFDRVAQKGVTTMANFLKPNMKLQQITIRFSDTIKARQISEQQEPSVTS